MDIAYEVTEGTFGLRMLESGDYTGWDIEELREQLFGDGRDGGRVSCNHRLN